MATLRPIQTNIDFTFVSQGKSEDEVATALFDCNWDETKAIELLLEEGGGLGGWEETGKKKTKKSDKDEASRENEDLNDDFDPTNLSDNRERSRNRGPPRLRNRGEFSTAMTDQACSDGCFSRWKFCSRGPWRL